MRSVGKKREFNKKEDAFFFPQCRVCSAHWLLTTMWSQSSRPDQSPTLRQRHGNVCLLLLTHGDQITSAEMWLKQRKTWRVSLSELTVEIRRFWVELTNELSDTNIWPFYQQTLSKVMCLDTEMESLSFSFALKLRFTQICSAVSQCLFTWVSFKYRLRYLLLIAVKDGWKCGCLCAF